MTLDEAIKHAEEIAEKCEFDTDWGIGNHFIDRSGVADIIKCAEEHRQLAEWLKELKQLKEQTKWIPVSQGMPEENKTVIASTKFGVYPEVRYSKKYGWEWAYEAGADYWKELKVTVTAWMPLPSPYKAESEEV